MAHGINQRRDLQQIGPGFWNVRRCFRILAKLLDIETQMSFIQLSNGKFLVIDTVDLDDQLEEDINHLTNNGENIEAVLGVHPFHTLSFLSFYEKYPHVSYYGTPRHQRRLSQIPWLGTFDQCHCRTQWSPEVELRIPAGTEFIHPQPESSNHFSSVFVYHRLSRTVHIDDTIIYSDKGNVFLRLFGYRHGSIAFHPSMKTVGLYPTAEAPFLFRDWFRQLLNDWRIENICCAHMGVKIGQGHEELLSLLNNSEKLFRKLSKRNQKRNPNGNVECTEDLQINLHDHECG